MRKPGQQNVTEYTEAGGTAVDPGTSLLSSPSAGSLKPMQPVLAPRSSTSNSQHLSRPQGIVKTSSRLPVPSAIPRPANRMPLVSPGVPSVRGAPAPQSLPARRGLPRSSALGHRGEMDGQVAIRVGAGQRLLFPEQLASFPSSFSQQWT